MFTYKYYKDMHYQENREVMLAQRCFSCKTAFRESFNRYYCCSKIKNVCQKCSKEICPQCKSPRAKKLKVIKCAFTKCQKPYIEEDMFYDFKKQIHLCPKCLARDYQFFYRRALHDKKQIQNVDIGSGSNYPYQQLVLYFKQWCFSCANRIGEEDAFQMVKGARICISCISVNVSVMQFMIKCIVCEGYIHSGKEIFQTYEKQSQVLCIYCAEKQKEHLSKKEIADLNSPELPKKKFVSALEKSKLKSQVSVVSEGEKKDDNIKRSKIQSLNSLEEEYLNKPLSIEYEKYKDQCQECRSFLNKENVLLLKRNDLKNTYATNKLFQKDKQEVKICFICFGENFQDKGETIQFETPIVRSSNHLEEEQTKFQPAKGVKSSVAGMGASHGLFSEKADH